MNKTSSAFKVAIIYFILSFLCKFLQNSILYFFGESNAKYFSSAQTINDLIFAVVTSFVLYFLVNYFTIRLIEKTNQYQDLIDNTTAVIFVKDLDGRYIFTNKKFEHLFHSERENRNDVTNSGLWSKEFSERFIANDREILEIGKSITFEETATLKDGAHIYYAIKFPLRNASEKIYAMGGIATDITDRKRVEKELEHSLALSRATLESTADGILVVDKDGHISATNQKFVDMWGIPKPIIESKNDSLAINFVLNQLESPDHFLSKVKELYANPKKESFDTLEFKNGKTFERYSKPQISGKEIIGRVWSFRDVTDHKRVEEADKKRVEKMIRFQETILALTQPQKEISLEGKLDYIMEMTSKAVDVERVSFWLFDEILSLKYSSKIYVLSNKGFIPGMIIRRKHYPEYFKAIEKFPLIDAHDAFNDPRTSEFSDNYLKPLGITSMMDIPIRIGGQIIGVMCQEHIGPKRIWSYEEQVFSSSIAGIIAVAIEHDRRLNAEMTIRQSEEKYRFLAETVPQLFWTAQPDGSVDYYNRNIYDYTGKSFENLKGWEWKSVIHPEDLEKFLPVWNECIQTGNPLQAEFRILGKDAIYRWHLSRAIPQKNDEGEIIKWFGSATDINEQKIAAEKMKLKNEELVKINNDLDNFVYTASHDLKAPIANIEGLLSTLVDSLDEECKPEEIVYSIIKMINASIEKFKNVIIDLTEISKAQKSSVNKVQKCNFSNIFEEIKTSIDPLIKTSKAVINTDFAKCPDIMYSRKNLRSIFYNILSNAIKYRSPDRACQIAIKTEIHDKFIVFSIIDNGLGMRPEIISQIFNMFKRFHTHVEGSGVGLYIVKRIVENSGGKIDVESEEGKGSTFKVYFKF
jgi:PAS domain S-box-containing protein